jgi:hypothetical protein
MLAIMLGAAWREKGSNEEVGVDTDSWHRRNTHRGSDCSAPLQYITDSDRIFILGQAEYNLCHRIQHENFPASYCSVGHKHGCKLGGQW